MALWGCWWGVISAVGLHSISIWWCYRNRHCNNCNICCLLVSDFIDTAIKSSNIEAWCMHNAMPRHWNTEDGDKFCSYYCPQFSLQGKSCKSCLGLLWPESWRGGDGVENLGMLSAQGSSQRLRKMTIHSGLPCLQNLFQAPHRQRVAVRQTCTLTYKTITLNCTARSHLTSLRDRGLKHCWVSNRMILVMLNNRPSCRPHRITHCKVNHFA